MRVSVYKAPDGVLSVWVEPSVGRGEPPVLLRGVTKGNVRASVAPVIERMRRQPAPTPAAIGQEDDLNGASTR